MDVKNTQHVARAPRKVPSLDNVKSTKKSPSPPASRSRGSSTSKQPPSTPKQQPAAKSSSKPTTGVKSDGSSTGSSAHSESTITSEGFTDYLSDESEAEIQRLAEEKAAKLPVSYEEDEEFASARKHLTRVGLRPPSQWTTARAATVAARSSTSRTSGYPSATTAFQRSLKA
jgi:hypothetical protein